MVKKEAQLWERGGQMMEVIMVGIFCLSCVLLVAFLYLDKREERKDDAYKRKNDRRDKRTL